MATKNVLWATPTSTLIRRSTTLARRLPLLLLLLLKSPLPTTFSNTPISNCLPRYIPSPLAQATDFVFYQDVSSPESQADELPSTPPHAITNCLPSPPITPIAKRSVKREFADLQFDKSDAPSPSIDFEPPKKRPRKVGRPRKSTTTTPTARTPKTAKTHRVGTTTVVKRRTTVKQPKLSLRRKLVATYGPSKRLSSTSSSSTVSRGKSTPKQRPSPSKTVYPSPIPRSPSAKVKSEDVDDEYVPKPVASPPKKKGRKPSAAAKKARKSSTSIPSRKTNNSLSATFSTTIRKRRAKIPKGGRWEGGIGRVCASYYASVRGIVPNPPGVRYHKGKPYSPAPPPSPSYCVVCLGGSDC